MANLQLQDIVLHYEETGTGQPLLLISGLGGDSQSWAQHISDLSKNHRVVSFDSRGSGRTSAPDRPYTIAQMANDASQLLEHLNIPTTHILSFSLLGGAIALQLALQDASHIDRIAIIASAGNLDNFSRSILNSWVSSRRSNLSREALVRLSAPFLYSRSFLNDETQLESMVLSTALNQFEQSDHAFIRQTEAILNWQPSKNLTTIPNPVLLLNGNEDQLVTPEQTNELAKSLPNCTTKQLAGGHAGLFELPDIYRTAILEFFNAPTATAS